MLTLVQSNVVVRELHSVFSDMDERQNVLKNLGLVGCEEIYRLENDVTYTTDVNFTLSALINTQTNIVTFVWMTQEQSNAAGEHFTNTIRELQKHVVGYVYHHRNILASCPESTTVRFKLYASPTVEVKFYSCETTIASNESNAWHFEGGFKLKKIVGTEIIAVYLMHKGDERSIKFLDICLNIECSSNCSITSSLTYVLPRTISSEVTACVCSIIHTSQRTEMTSAHHSHCFERRKEEILIRADRNETAKATMFFELPTAVDRSYHYMRHENSIGDIQMICAK